MDYVHRTNLIPDPRFRHVDSISSQGGTVKTVDHENGNRYLQITYDGRHADPYVQPAADIITVPGRYRLNFDVFAKGGTGYVRVYTRENGVSGYDNSLSVSVADWQSINKASDPFTLKTITIVRIVPPRTIGGFIMVTKINLELASTFDESLPYFDWATMPDPRGGGVFVLALSLLVLSALSGGLAA